MLLQELIQYLEAFAPLNLAEGWDNVGLLLGDPAQAVQRVMTCLTVTPESVAEAVAARVNCMVSHHPVLFQAVKRLTAADANGRLLLPLLRAGTAVYSPHTAFDNCVGGINDLLSGLLELQDLEPLVRTPTEPKAKLVAFVPECDLDRVSSALFAAGAGRIGNYEQCSFRAAGTGTFFGGISARPTVGQAGRREEVAEWRLEVVVPAVAVSAVVRALRLAHSYEEPAYDIYPLQTEEGSAGAGRIGNLPRPLPLRELAKKCASCLAAPATQFVGDPNHLVTRVAVACGAGGSLLSAARRTGAEVLLTGEMRFHDQLAALEQGLGVVLAGHYATERLGVQMLADQLAKRYPSLQVWASRQEKDPAQPVDAKS